MDSWLVSLVDRALAIPQRRGVPLAAVLGAIETGYLAFVAFGFAFAVLRADTFNAAMWVGIALWRGPARLDLLRRRRHDAETWGPDRAMRYHELAGKALLTRLPERRSKTVFAAVMIPFAFAFIHLSGSASEGTRLLGYTLGIYAAAFLTLALESYADCALPRDPDATARTLAPAPA